MFKIIIAILVLLSGLVALPGVSESESFQWSSSWLQKKLTIPQDVDAHKLPAKNEQVIYVMGGKETDLKRRFSRAAELFHAGLGDKIIIFIQPGITAFDQTLGRNLTNKEWAARQLLRLDVLGDDIIYADFKEGFFGTLTEIENLLQYVRQHGYNYVYIVTSKYHTKRVWLTFSGLSRDKPVPFTVYAAPDVENIKFLLIEYSKMLLYKKIFIPLYGFLSE